MSCTFELFPGPHTRSGTADNEGLRRSRLTAGERAVGEDEQDDGGADDDSSDEFVAEIVVDRKSSLYYATTIRLCQIPFKALR